MAFTSFGDTWVWFMGIVEDIDDPEQLGRVRVRILSLEEFPKIKKEDLLWCWPISPIQSASLNSVVVEGGQVIPGPRAVGMSPTGIQNNSYVFGFFIDGAEANMPFIFGTYHKKSVRFKNECIEDQDLLNDVSALARGEQTLLKVKAKGELSVDSYAPLTVSEGGGFIEEPDPGFGAKYPHNKTFTTRTGHAVEIDDTPGAERIHIYHRMGTYSEMYANGDRVQKIIGDDYEIVCKDKKLLVRGNLSIETDAAATILVKDNAHIWVGGNVTQVVEKNVDQLVKGNVREEIEGSKDVYVHGDLNYVVGGNMSYAVEGTAEINSMGDMSFRTSAMQNFYVEGNQTVYIQGSQNITIVSSKIEYAQSGTVIYGSGLLYIVSGEVIATTTPLTLHVHMDTPGYGMGVTTPPIF